MMHGKVGLSLLAGLFTVFPALAADDHRGIGPTRSNVSTWTGCVRTPADWTFPAVSYARYPSCGTFGITYAARMQFSPCPT